MDTFRLLVKSGRCTAYEKIRPTRKPKLNYSDFLFRQQKDLHLINPLKPELNPICNLLALLGAHHFLHVSRIRVKLLTLR